MLNPEELAKQKAVVSWLPSFTGDGYGFGGGAVVTIGDRVIQFGEGWEASKLAEEVAARWNAAERFKAIYDTASDLIENIREHGAHDNYKRLANALEQK